MFPKLLCRRAGRIDRKLARGKQRERLIRQRSLRLESLETRDLMASLSWSPGPDLPYELSDAAAIHAWDDSIVLLGGGTKDVSRLAIDAASWTAAPDLDAPRVSPGAGLLYDGTIHVFGGETTAVLDSAISYDFTAENNAPLAAMSTPRTEHAFIDAYSMALGGLDDSGNVLSSVEYYDLYSDTWYALADLPSAKFDFAAATDGNSIYAFGGADVTDATSVSNTVQRYDWGTGEWSAASPMPIATRGSVAVLGVNGVIYVIGGRTSTGAIADVQAYDPATDTWSLENSLPSPVSDASAVSDAQGRLMIIGGRDDAGQDVASVLLSQTLYPDVPPSFETYAPTSVFATDSYIYDVDASGLPTPTYSLVDAPAGMTIDGDAGLITWIPSLTQIGAHLTVVRATNAAGFVDQEFVVTVADPAPVITTTAPTTASIAVPYAYDVNATGFPAPTFSLAANPAGMSINPDTGVLSWTPSETQTGGWTVTVVAQNSNGASEQSFTIAVADLTPPTAPATVAVTELTQTSVSLVWSAATDNVGVAKYQVYEQYKYGWRNSRTGYRLIQDDVAGTSTTITGLTPNTTYKYVVRAVDLAGNMSANSNLVTTKTYVAPTLTTYSSLTATANHDYTLQLTSVANPAPAFSIVSGPAGMTVNAATGLVSWTPATPDVGTAAAIFRATNVVGSRDLAVNITVKSDLPVLTALLSTGTVVAGQPMTIQVRDASATSPTYSIVSGPVGMTIDSATGLASWTPSLSDAGSTAVTFRAVNSAGGVNLTVTFYTYFTSQPTSLAVTNPGAFTPNLSWATPDSAAGIAGYKITASYVTGLGSRAVTHTKTLDSPGAGVSKDLAGLVVGKDYTFKVSAYDASGNVSLTSAPLAFRYAPAIPNVGWVVNGNQPVVANQAMTIQLTDYNADPRTFSIVSAPTGMTIDSTTGLISWTPGVADIGNISAKIRAVNSIGPKDVVVNFPVYFSGAPTNIATTRAGDTAFVSWSAPTDNAVPIVSYQVYIQWSINGHTYNRTETTTATSHSYWLVGGPVVHKVKIAAVDALGRVGFFSPLAPVR